VSKVLHTALWLSVLVLAATVAMLGFTIHDGRDLVKLRNSLLYEVGPATVFDWTPDSAPRTYLEETRPPPRSFAAIADGIHAESADSSPDVALALAIARHLVANQHRPAIPIQASTEQAYRDIVEKGRGYCADYTQAFNGLALAAGLEVREWGMSFQGYGGDGHAFSEIYDHARGKWVFLDSFNAFYIVSPAGTPLSVSELRDALLGHSGGVLVRHLSADKFGFKNDRMALDYYARGLSSLFMVWGNNVFSYDADPVVKLAGKLSRSTEQAAAIVRGLQPRLMIAAGTENDQGLAALREYRVLLALVAASVMVCAVLSVFLIVRRRASRHAA
jgi:Transglutaminase-like superfamily